ncbi:OprD family outer membrane porin [Nitrosophilus alvini]|uniref:OprD family outer membrane porin n=1 Tax=Nitrosophilus alvini TaxID=2714855 RepID=UPI001909AC49|nr:OprD family outer membrane porin [Nitrosophilus alvini]
MKKFAYSIIAASLLLNLGYAADSLEEAVANGKFKGHIRSFYIDRNWEGALESAKTDYSAFAVGIDLKYETASFYGLSAGIALYSDNDFGLNSSDLSKVHKSILGDNADGYSFVGEAYLQYKQGNTTFKAGRQRLDTPLAAADDARMIPTLFEAYVLTNTDLPDTTLVAAHVTKIAPGTFFNQYRSTSATGQALALTAGYGANADASIGKFQDMGWYAIGKETNGVTAGAIIYKGIKNVTLQAWDYYAHDILNAVYLQADFKWNCLISDQIKPFAAIQYINEKDVGDRYAGEIDGSYMGAKVGASYNNFTLYGAYSASDSNTDAAVNGGIITPWGGMPAFTQGMVTRHQFFADTNAWKIAGSYKFKEPNLKTVLYYTSYDVGKDNAYSNGHSWIATEAGFDFIYYPKSVKNLQLRFRGNFPRSFYESANGDDLGWNEYRFIVNYNF